jgi:hypothetical protein
MDPGDVRATRDRLMKRYCECRSMSEKWDNKSMSFVLQSRGVLVHLWRSTE